MENMEPIASNRAAEEGELVKKLQPSSPEAEAKDGPTPAASILPPAGLKAKDLTRAGMLETSDLEGWKQLLFHFGVLGCCAWAVSRCLAEGRWGLLALAYVPYAVAISLLFNGFHELVHNTAFRTPALNTGLAHLLGFLNFRGATWFWCFHWAHHRYTNDPLLDPELSGDSVDHDDPSGSFRNYLAFLSGYPFGFERVFGVMVRHALPSGKPDPWVANKPAKTVRLVRLESAAYLAGYALLAVAGALSLTTNVEAFAGVGKCLVLYWLLPHCLGAGHLRMYQFAEHRACQLGSYTQTNAWICARTTLTWAPYAKLAWYMPYHVEHHSWPNVPFHKLRTVHEMARAAYEAEGAAKVPTGCNPSGVDGYANLHVVTFRTMLKNVWP